jgi:phytoene synthase
MDSFDHAAEIVRTDDRDRYLADLFAPEAARRHLFALHAFNIEIARIRGLVSDPTVGEIRMQFWQDAIHADGAGHPVGRAMVETISAFNLPLAALDNLIDARRFDLYDDAMPSLNDLEGYAGDTSSSLMQLAAIILAGGRDPGTADIAGHGGVAYALTGLMRALPVHAARGQCYLPADLLGRQGIGRDEAVSGQSSPELDAVLAELRAAARRHLDAARELASDLDRPLLPAFLPLALVGPELERMDRRDYQPFERGAEMSRLRRQWLLWRAARRDRL